MKQDEKLKQNQAKVTVQFATTLLALAKTMTLLAEKQGIVLDKKKTEDDK